jgi:hypothetical protein
MKLILSVATLIAFAGVSACEDSASEPEPPLTIPQALWSASNYCGDTTPEIPENPVPAYRFEFELLDSKLTGEGLRGWIHGSVPNYGHFVFTYRKEDTSDPMAFFKSEQFSLIPATSEVADVLATLNRHDEVRLKGLVFQNASPLTHIRVSEVEVLERFALATENHYSFDPTPFAAEGTQPVFGMLHAMAVSPTFGQALIIEHKDFILPVSVPKALDSATANLYRGDILQVMVKAVRSPGRPLHLVLDAAAERPIQTVDSMLNCHNKEITVEGHLAKFEKSPAISTDVYAIRVVDSNGMARNCTLFPDTDDGEQFAELFFALAEKAKVAWEASTQEPRVVRNFRDKAKVKVSAKGRLNVVSSEQANAQIYIKSVDDLTLTVIE